MCFQIFRIDLLIRKLYLFLKKFCASRKWSDLLHQISFERGRSFRFTLLYKKGFIYNPIFICHIPWNCRRRLYFNLKIQSFPGGDTPVPLQNFWPHKYYLRLTHSNIGKLRPWSSFSNVGWKSAILHGNLHHNTSRFHSQQQEKWMNAVTILFLKFWKSKQTGQNFSAKNAKYYKKK